MLMRVVVVAFVLSTLGADAMAQATRPASSTAGTIDAPPATPVPPATPATQPLVTTPPASTRPINRSADETLRQMLQPQGDAARPLKPVEEAPPAVDATSGVAAVAPGATPRIVL